MVGSDFSTHLTLKTCADIPANLKHSAVITAVGAHVLGRAFIARPIDSEK